MQEPTYSICITHYNDALTLVPSLESILNQLDDRFEVIVVDNLSNDGSYELLESFQRSGRIKLVREHCSRGKGRQIAYELSKGRYIVANMDLDDEFKPRLRELLGIYHTVAEGSLLWVYTELEEGFWGGECITIVPRDLVKRLGGWKDVQLYEDSELSARAAGIGKYARGRFSLIEKLNPHNERKRSSMARIRWKYLRYREIVRCGFPMQLWTEKETLAQAFFRVTMKNVAFPAYRLLKPDFYFSEGENLNASVLHDRQYYVELGSQSSNKK